MLKKHNIDRYVWFSMLNLCKPGFSSVVLKRNHVSASLHDCCTLKKLQYFKLTFFIHGLKCVNIIVLYSIGQRHFSELLYPYFDLYV